MGAACAPPPHGHHGHVTQHDPGGEGGPDEYRPGRPPAQQPGGPPAQPPGGLPAQQPQGEPPQPAQQPAPQQPAPQPPLTDAELAAFRQWQAEHYPRGQHHPVLPYEAPVPYEQQAAQGGAASQQPQDEPLRTELAGMREQLTALAQSQQRVERATNPPLWKRVLRSTPVRWAAGLLVLLAIGSWAINHYLGGSDDEDNPQAKLPPSRSQVQARVGMESPKDAVAQVYRTIGNAAANPDSARSYANNACLIFTESAARKFGSQLGAPSCKQAFGKPKVTDPESYEQVNLGRLPPVPDGAKTTTIDSCSFEVTGGPRLGKFTLRLDSSGKWLISDVRPSHCG